MRRRIMLFALSPCLFAAGCDRTQPAAATTGADAVAAAGAGKSDDGPTGSELGKIEIIETPEATSYTQVIRLQNPRIVGGTDGDDTPALFLKNVVSDGRGGIIIGETYSGLPALVSNDSTRTIGGKGEGPGEFNFIDDVTAVGDSIFIMDGHRTLHVFGPDLKFKRSFQLAANVSSRMFITPTRIFAVRGESRTAVPAFSMFDRMGTLLKDFGPVFQVPMANLYSLGGSAREIVAGPRQAYRFTYYSHDGDSISTTDRMKAQKWFEPVEWPRCPGMMARTASPPSSISALHMDARSRTWAIVNHRVPKCPSRLPADGAPMGPVLGEELTDVRFEVYQGHNPNPIASLLVDEWFRGFVDDTHVWRVVELPDGSQAIEIWEISIVPR